jgi:hypothetical protein
MSSPFYRAYCHIPPGGIARFCAPNILKPGKMRLKMLDYLPNAGRESGVGVVTREDEA